MFEPTHHVFHSMGIPVHITLAGVKKADSEKIISEVEKTFHAYDERFSRFKETSELHKINTSNNQWVAVSLPMFQVLEKCVKLAEETNGVFDPSVGGVLASYGYGLPEKYTLPAIPSTYRDIEFNDRELSVRLAPGQVLEPASVVKGMAIDEAGRILSESKVPGYLINAGGDMVTHGSYVDGKSWNIAIQDPRNLDAIVGAVALRDAGMATSGVYQTKGVHGGTPWHHLVNMRTGKPTEGGIASATIIANTCEEADTEASLIILLPEEEAVARLTARGLPYFLIHSDGRVAKSATFAALEVPIQSLII